MTSRGYSSKSSNVSLAERDSAVIAGSSDEEASREVAAIIVGEFPAANEKVVEWIQQVESPQSTKPSPIQSKPNVR